MFDQRESILLGLMSLFWVSEGVDHERRLRNGVVGESGLLGSIVKSRIWRKFVISAFNYTLTSTIQTFQRKIHVLFSIYVRYFHNTWVLWRRTNACVLRNFLMVFCVVISLLNWNCFVEFFRKKSGPCSRHSYNWIKTPLKKWRFNYHSLILRELTSSRKP